MANQKKPNVMANIWSNWCNLPIEQRNQVAQKLGPLGHALSIAANVHQFATQQNSTSQEVEDKDSKVQTESNSKDENVIDAEFEEVT